MDRKKFTVVGHRGSGSGVHPEGGAENSLRSFERCFADGADEAELDLALSHDGTVFVYHDPVLKMPDGSKRKVAELDFDQIRVAVPTAVTIEELKEHFPGKTFVIELKSHTNYRRIIDYLFEKQIVEPKTVHFKFISFSIDALIQIKRRSSGIYCSYISTCVEERFEPFVGPKQIERCRAAGMEEVSGHWLGFRPGAIRRARAAGLNIGLGFINNRRLLNYCVRNDITRLFTDRTRELVALIEQN